MKHIEIFFSLSKSSNTVERSLNSYREHIEEFSMETNHYTCKVSSSDEILNTNTSENVITSIRLKQSSSGRIFIPTFAEQPGKQTLAELQARCQEIVRALEAQGYRATYTSKEYENPEASLAITEDSSRAARSISSSPIRFTPQPQSSSSSSSSSYSTLPSQNAYASTSYSGSSSGGSSYSSGLTQEHASTKKRSLVDDNGDSCAKRTVQSSSSFLMLINKVYADVTKMFNQLEDYHKKFLSGIFKIYKDRNNKEFFNEVANQIRLLKSSSVALNSIGLSMESIIQLDDIKISDLSSLKEDLLDFITTKVQSPPQLKKACKPSV